MVLFTYAVSPFTDHIEESILGAKERQGTTQQNIEHDTAAPDVDWFTVRLPLHNFWRHEVRRADAPWQRGVLDASVNLQVTQRDNFIFSKSKYKQLLFFMFLMFANLLICFYTRLLYILKVLQ